jgi:hypothetical protein
MMFDFEKGYWPDGMRITYKMIKWCFLEDAFSLCLSGYPNKDSLNKSLHHPIQHQSEYAWAYEQCEGLCRIPIELLMYEVVALVMLAGRNEVFDAMCRNKIALILERNDLAMMLNLLPEQEKNEFEHDLKRLRIV